jgi:hypothetical protein
VAEKKKDKNLVESLSKEYVELSKQVKNWACLEQSERRFILLSDPR